MRDMIRNLLREHISEAFVRSDLSSQERYDIVANKIIEFMDNFGIVSIPTYSTLENWRPTENETYRPNMKYLLQKFLVADEYLNKVVPKIKSIRPEFTFSSKGKHLVDDEVVVFSNGEKIVYNTFKMNGIKLIPQPKQFEFKYTFKGQPKIKKPDFLWKQRNELIEVAGLEDESYGTDYMKKMKAAKKRIEMKGIKMTVLDYFSYRKNLQGFYEYVCKTFGFPYEPMNFWQANIVKDLPVEDLKREVEELIKKGTLKTSGERWRQNKIITQLLTKEKSDGDFFQGKPEGYKSASEFKKETGIGLRETDPTLREQVRKAWCESTGSNRGTYEKFKELFEEVPISITTIENVKKRFPSEFNRENREKICSGSGLEMKTETKEAELSERCWKGYTQKGMKTMFGKRYPNCVKIKK